MRTGNGAAEAMFASSGPLNKVLSDVFSPIQHIIFQARKTVEDLFWQGTRRSWFGFIRQACMQKKMHKSVFFVGFQY